MITYSHLVAAVQFDPKLLEPQKNLITASQLVLEAAARGAKIIVLPELSISGQFLNNANEAATCCQTKDGYQTQKLFEIARLYDVIIVFGYAELYENNFYNSAAVISQNGIIGNVRKHNLWGSDYLWAKSNDDIHPVINTKFGRIGVLLGKDSVNEHRKTYPYGKQAAPFYRPGMVDVMCLLSNWSTDLGFPDASWVGLNEQLGCNVIVSNRIGVEKETKFKGGSCIIDKTAKIYTFGSSFTEASTVGGYILV